MDGGQALLPSRHKKQRQAHHDLPDSLRSRGSSVVVWRQHREMQIGP